MPVTMAKEVIVTWTVTMMVTITVAIAMAMTVMVAVTIHDDGDCCFCVSFHPQLHVNDFCSIKPQI